MTIVLAATSAGLFGFGTYLLLQRQLTRIVIGLAMLSHGANLLIVMSRGGRGNPTFIGTADVSSMVDPLPQAFVLTAIVIAFGTTSLLLALAYRSWVITHDDEVEDDVEDRLVQLRQEAKEVDALAAAAADEVDYDQLEDNEDDQDHAGRPEPSPSASGAVGETDPARTEEAT
jgi:multicomponent Na+:H+ antiporter subunit C